MDRLVLTVIWIVLMFIISRSKQAMCMGDRDGDHRWMLIPSLILLAYSLLIWFLEGKI